MLQATLLVTVVHDFNYEKASSNNPFNLLGKVFHPTLQQYLLQLG